MTARPVPSKQRYGDVVRQLASAQKSNRGAPGYSRWVNRRLGRFLAAAFFLRGMTPNQVTVLSTIVTAAGIATVATLHPSWPHSLLTVALLLFGYALDSADGQLARLQGGGSPAGEWLDHVSDAAKVCAFHLAIAVCWFRYYELTHAAVLLIPLAYTLVQSVFFFAVILVDELRRIYRGTSNAVAVPGARAPALRSILVLPADYGVLCLTLLLLSLHTAFIVVYVVLLAANTLYLVGALRNWFTELHGLERV